MARRKDGGHGGGHGWFVTFADLMGLLVAFFVMLVAGSMRDAFGVQEVRYAGIIETDGLPTRPKLKNAERIRPEDASNTPAADQRDHDRQVGAKLSDDRAFAL